MDDVVDVGRWLVEHRVGLDRAEALWLERLAAFDHGGAELEGDNHRLRQQLSSAQAETREVTDALDAARAVNRQLMSEFNRPNPSPPGDGRRSQTKRRQT